MTTGLQEDNKFLDLQESQEAYSNIISAKDLCH